MKTFFYLILFTIGCKTLQAQITTPVIKAGFGVDADLGANFFNNGINPGNDDWFNNGTSGTGAFVIDTTGAASINAKYASNPLFRQLPFYRTMKYPAFSVINNRLLLDAIFIRDYHGDDSTVFANGASKNGESPANWTCPVSQSVPDKNEILDVMVHVRREGPNFNDSLWMFGGVSIENTTGDRYFDFEMYQTDLYYNRATQKFYGYGPDAGHTSWLFDAAGNVTRPGDIIFSAEYGSSTLTSIEARIWIDKASLAITPASFSWSGSFNGATNGSQYGYASITPKSLGVFYAGMESASNTWAGPFSLIRGDNSVVTNYTAGQYMEFSVNLTKLGLDPVTSLGGNCQMPFKRVLVKSRASTSFTAALKDFVGPFDFFFAPKASINTDQSKLCGLIGVSNLKVINPISTSIYTWTTTNGNIAGSNIGNSITVNSAGTYVVKQQLQAGCNTYATDTIVISSNPDCFVLENAIKSFSGHLLNDKAELDWSVSQNSQLDHFYIEKSIDGIHFVSLKKIESATSNNIFNYSVNDYLSEGSSAQLFYRIKMVDNKNNVAYSKVVTLFNPNLNKPFIKIVTNPVQNSLQLNIESPRDYNAQLFFYDITGKVMMNVNRKISKGLSALKFDTLDGWAPGIYVIKVIIGKNIYSEKMVMVK